WASSFSAYVLLAMLLGALSAVLGMLGSAVFNLPSGPSIVTTQLLLFVLSLGVKGARQTVTFSQG
ncbi:MAG: metal ABC transporter permease, partial [Thermostichus sp. DG02_4_bins_136]